MRQGVRGGGWLGCARVSIVPSDSRIKVKKPETQSPKLEPQPSTQGLKAEALHWQALQPQTNIGA